MKFTGHAPGLTFADTEADCPPSLLQKLDPTATEETMRCWVLVQGGESKALWAEIFLNIPGYFLSILAFVPNPDEIQIRFRSKNYGAVLPLDQDITALTLEESFSGDESGPPSSTASDEQATDPGSSSSQAANLYDPITGKAVQNIEDPCNVVFYAKKIQSEDSMSLRVSKSGLEAYVACALNDGKDIFRLKVARGVLCSDERKRSFSLTPTVWADSLLPQSRTLTQLFLKASEIDLRRRQQLSSLEDDQDLSTRVQFWLSDMLCFHEKALERLTFASENGPADGIPPFMSRFYFEAAEARNLGKFIMPNGMVIQDSLYAQQAVGCDSQHINLGIVLCTAFDIEARFHMEASFQRMKAHWLRKRREEMELIEYPRSDF